MGQQKQIKEGRDIGEWRKMYPGQMLQEQNRTWKKDVTVDKCSEKGKWKLWKIIEKPKGKRGGKLRIWQNEW